MSSVFREHGLTLILLVIIILMGAEIVYLAVQNNRLKSLVRDPKKYIQTLSSKDQVPAFTARDLNGNDVSVQYSDSAPYTQLFWFSPTCDACVGNIDFWNDIYDRFTSGRFRYLGLCAGDPDEARAYIEDHTIRFPVICAFDPFIMESYRGNVLPQMMLVSPGGSVVQVWAGTLEEEQQAEIIALLEAY